MFQIGCQWRFVEKAQYVDIICGYVWICRYKMIAIVTTWEDNAAMNQVDGSYLNPHLQSIPLLPFLHRDRVILTYTQDNYQAILTYWQIL